MVKKYKRSDKIRLSKNFRLDEFKCKCGKCDPILVDDALVTWLQKIRDHFGRSVNINSGYRCAAHNAMPLTWWELLLPPTLGLAADIRVEGILPSEVAKYAESIGIQRIGLYDTFVHIGSGTEKKFWKGHEGTKVETFGGKPKTVTLDDPIPYDGNMALEMGKYYIQDSVIYLCTRDTGNPVYHALADLAGLYVEIV